MFRSVSLLLCFSLALAALGCGVKKYPVNGVVKLDGKPVAEATVVFVSEDGGTTASGFTDDSGAFSLTFQNGPGVPAGTYKVVVTKTDSTAEGVAPGDPAEKASAKQYEADMKKHLSKGGPPGGMMTPMPGKTGGMPKPAGGGGQAKGQKSLLPAPYANAGSTPITIQVPAPENSVTIELKSKQ